MVERKTTGWAIKFDTTNQLDGRRVYFWGCASVKRHPAVSGYKTMVFRTRQAARDYINERWGYTRNRPDLRAEPHCWRMPKPVKVTVTVAEQS